MMATIFGSDGLIVLIIAVVVLFGGSQLPKLAKNIGSAGHEFRKAQREAEEEHAKTETAIPVPVVVAPAAQAAPQVALPATDDRLVVSRSELKQELASLIEERDKRDKPSEPLTQA